MNMKALLLAALSAAGVNACSFQPSTTKVAAVGALSTVFSTKCASCHGDQGEGDIGPKLTGLSLEAYSAAVREGRAGMPAFPEATYSEADLKKDHAAL
ncbi:MAG: cytochrome c [Deltaproteobacteria bacterium]|nr:cytochrome c [Deltaproteobacteria bacterium]